MKKILLTGFAPFQNFTSNPSELVVRKIVSDSSFRDLVDGLVLSVSYEGSFKELEKVFNPERHSRVLMLGLAAGRRKISLERVALNWIESSAPDDDGKLSNARPLIAGALSALISPLPLVDWAHALDEAGIPSEVSLNAGGYVCNSLYFRTLFWLNDLKGGLFVHLPPLPSSAQDFESTMDLGLQVQGVQILLQKLAALELS